MYESENTKDLMKVTKESKHLDTFLDKDNRPPETP